jgi:hypothetical protein
MNMRKRYPVLKIIAIVIAVALFVFGAKFFVESQKGFAQFLAWFEAKPVDIEVDFSKPGTYSSGFEQTCSVSYSELFVLEVPESVFRNRDTDSVSLIDALLSKLEASCTITDSNGDEIATLALPDPNSHRNGIFFDNLVPLNEMPPFKNGTYRIFISVSKGAPALSGIKQRFAARYLLCGMEQLPAALSRLASIVCFIIGSVIVLTMLLMAVIKARKNRQSAPAQKPL